MIAVSRRLPWLVALLALLVLAAVVFLTTLQVRQRIRAQLAGRDGEVLHAVALMQYSEDVADGLGGPITDPGNQLSIVLKSAHLKGVLGVRLFDAEGSYVESFPPYVTEGALTEQILSTLKTLAPVSQFHPRVEPAKLFYSVEEDPQPGTVPLLEVDIPLHEESGPLAGIAQFLIEGHSIAAEYAQLDRSLAIQALTAFAVGAAVLLAGLGWAFRRLQRANRLLAERTNNLVKANQELALAAKTSALGTVTAHLIHGLKNPLAGLQSFVASHGVSGNGCEESDWHLAVASTRRMQTLISQVTSVLREQQAGREYEVTLTELAEMVRGRVNPLAQERAVRLQETIHSEASLSNRVANLVVLVLANLLENAIQVTPRGEVVSLELKCSEQGLLMEVRDRGPGFPSGLPLFMPCTSHKEGGTGIGLALCKQLANHLGAELELASSTPQGCVFALRLRHPQIPTPRDPAELAGSR